MQTIQKSQIILKITNFSNKKHLKYPQSLPWLQKWFKLLKLVKLRTYKKQIIKPSLTKTNKSFFPMKQRNTKFTMIDQKRKVKLKKVDCIQNPHKQGSLLLVKDYIQPKLKIQDLAKNV